MHMDTACLNHSNIHHAVYSIVRTFTVCMLVYDLNIVSECYLSFISCMCLSQDCRNVILIFSVRESGRFQGIV